MATYTTKRCPHCGHAYVFHSRNNQFYWGPPYKVCEQCGEVFIDKDGHEMAAEYSDVNSAISALKAKGNRGAIFFIILGALMIVMLLAELGKQDTGAILLGVAFGVFFVIDGIYRLSSTNSGETIDYIQSEYSASLDRLQDPVYIEAYNRIARKPYIRTDSRDRRETEETQTKQSVPETIQYTEPSKETDQKDSIPPSNKVTIYCRKCGARIPTDSVFCQKCGERVVHVD